MLTVATPVKVRYPSRPGSARKKCPPFVIGNGTLGVCGTLVLGHPGGAASLAARLAALFLCFSSSHRRYSVNEHFKHDLRGNGLLIVFPITLWDLLEERDDEIEDSSPK
jgi:hypothetical protein